MEKTNESFKISNAETIMLNAYAANELSGGLAGGRMARIISDSFLRYKFVWHCAEETRHAYVWYELMRELNIPSLEIHASTTTQKSYWTYAKDIKNVIEYLAYVHVYELRVPFHFNMHKEWTKSARIKEVLQQLIKEEGPHLSWIRDYLKKEKEKGNYIVDIALKKYLELEKENYRSDLKYLESLGKEALEFVKIIRRNLKEQEKKMLDAISF